MEHFYLTAPDGQRLHCGKWLPETEVRAVVQIVHGIAEHIGRYEAFAAFLAEHGFAVFAEDHMGHGQTGAESSEIGCFRGGWMTAVSHIKLLRDHAHAEYPDAPYFLFGHSMGSFLTRTYLYTYPDSLDAAVLSGTGWEDRAVLRLGLVICRREERRLGQNVTSPLLNSLLFGSYSKPFAPNRTTHDWICSVDEEVDAYLADPMCGFDASIGLARDMLSGIRMNEQKKNLQKMNRQLPVLFLSGEKDPVGHMTVGVRKCEKAFRRVGMQKLTELLYPNGRHEMLHEANKQTVYSDVLAWLCGQEKSAGLQ